MLAAVRVTESPLQETMDEAVMATVSAGVTVAVTATRGLEQPLV